jgi:Cytochrome c
MPRSGIVSFRHVRALAAVLALFLILPATSLPQTPAGKTGLSKREETGKRIYMEGTSSSGAPLRAWIRGDVPISGKIVPCVRCHRRSGMGALEGRIVVHPVTGAALYRPKEFYSAPQDRIGPSGRDFWPVYTDESLAAAIVGGIDPNGRVMDPSMPRYDMTDQDLKFLIAYLKSMTIAAPGVTDNVLRFATVVDTRVDATKRKEMLDVLRAAFRDMNGGARHERRRRTLWSRWSTQGYIAYRLAELDVWEVSGPEETWEAQLEEYYRRNPVFALVSGIAAGGWEPVHGFCERREIPCVLPNTDLPSLDGENYTTFYFSKGVALEAAAIARHLEADEGPAGTGPVVQIFRAGVKGTTAAASFREAMRKRGTRTVRDLRVEDGHGLTAAFWRSTFAAERPSAIVLWLPDTDLKGLGGMGDSPYAPSRIYLSASLGAGPKTAIPGTLAGRTFLAYPFLLPSEEHRQTERTRIWLKARRIAGPDERLQVDTFFAASLVGMAVKGMSTFLSRDYFIELVEHKTEYMVAPSAFPRVSLGPGQRFASKGCYMLRYPTRPGGEMVPDGGWIIP